MRASQLYASFDECRQSARPTAPNVYSHANSDWFSAWSPSAGRRFRREPPSSQENREREAPFNAASGGANSPIILKTDRLTLVTVGHR